MMRVGLQVRATRAPSAAVTLFAVRNGMLPVGSTEDAERREGHATG